MPWVLVMLTLVLLTLVLLHVTSTRGNCIDERRGDLGQPSVWRQHQESRHWN